MLKLLSCSGGHLGCPIDTKKKQQPHTLCTGSFKAHPGQLVCFQMVLCRFQLSDKNNFKISFHRVLY